MRLYPKTNQLRSIPGLVLGALTVLTAPVATAQLIPGTPYQLTRGANTFVPLPNPTVLWATADDETLPVTLPFPIKFYGTTQTSVSVDSNGAIAFPAGTSISRFNNAPGTTGTPSGFVAPMWDDLLLDPAPNSGIGYQVQGVVPTRTITFEWRNLGFYSLGSVVGNMSFQVRFYEGASGRIDIDYGPATGTFGSSATMGMENTMDGGPILFLTNGCTDNCQFANFPANTRVTVTQDPGVDLLAVGVQPPEFAFLGAQLAMPITVQNLHGMSIGPFVASVVVSPTLDFAGAMEIGTTTLTLSPFELRSLSVLTVPPSSLGPNPVYVGVVMDSTNAVTEVEENNNLAISPARMRLVLGNPDLAVQRVRSSVVSANAGDTFDVYARIQNVGGEPANNVEAAIILSTNPVISPQDVKLATYGLSLAPGETMNATVAVTIDAATNSGTYYIGALADPDNTLEELSESNNGLADIRPIVITGGALAVVTTALPNALLGRSYVARLAAGNGDPADRTWTISQGTLPAGIGLAATSGEIFGRPTAAETQTFTVRVESGGESATRALTLTVVDPSEPLTIVTRSVMAAVIGQEYVFPIVATGGSQPDARTWSATGLPDGIQLTEQGALVGTPEVASTSTIVVTVTDGVETASRDLMFEVLENANLLIVPRQLSTARFGMPYTEMLEATGMSGPVTWLIDLGRLPAGLSLSTSGAITGTPTQVGRFRFVVEARDPAAGQASDQNSFEIIVLDDGAFVIDTVALPEARQLEGYSAAIIASGGLAPFTWTIREGRLPEGLVSTVDEGTGEFRIAGQAAEIGVSNIIVEVADSQGRVATRAFALRVVTAPPPAVTEPPGGCSCDAAPADRGAGPTAGVLIVLAIALGWRRRRL